MNSASFVATSLVQGHASLEAPGKLTIRGVTRDLRLPLTIRPAGDGLELSGSTSFKRLDFGIGAGWAEREYRAFDIPFKSPKERVGTLRETLVLAGMTGLLLVLAIRKFNVRLG